MRWAWSRRPGSRSGAKRHGRRLAVLPLGPDPFASGLTEELTALLRRAPDLEVIAHTSARRYGGSAGPLTHVAGALGADILLTGAASRMEGRIALSVRLVEGIDDRQRWAHEWDGTSEDVFAIQNDAARRVATELGVSVADGVDPLLHREPTSDLDAHEDYLRGRFYLGRDTSADILTAIACFESALDRDPSFALAWSGLADCYARGPTAGMRPDEAARRARQAAEEAASLDADLPDAHAVLARIATSEWRWGDAERGFARALELAPSHARAHHGRATLLLRTGSLEDAIEAFDRARALDPCSDEVLTESAWPLLQLGRFEESAERSRQVVHRDPENPMAYFNLGNCAARGGRREESITFYRAAAELSASVPFITAFLGMALVGVGDREEAETIAADLRRKAERGTPVATSLGALLVHLGRLEKGLGWLEHGLENREPLALAMDTWLLPLPQVRENERFRQLCARAPRPNMIGRRP